MRTALLLSFVGFVSLTTSASAENCRAAAYPVSIDDNYDHTAWIDADRLDEGDILVRFGGFTAMYDGPDDDDDNADTQNLLNQPQWVSHEVKRYAEDGMFVYADGFKRPNPWYELSKFPIIPSTPGVTDIDLDKSYAGEGTVWNRGHMATRNLVNRMGEEAGCNTHTFVNSVPQYWSFNQGEWLALENYVGALANEYGQAWQISGPIFLPDLEIETIGAQDETKIPIPHAVFKVIIFEIDSDIYVRAFVFYQPNYEKVRAIMAANGNKAPLMGFRLCRTTDQEDYDFEPHKSSLTEIENLTGIRFFPDATPSEKEALDDYSSRGIWRVDRRFFERPCGGEIS